MTEYVVMRAVEVADPGGGPDMTEAWEVLGQATASGSKQAIKAVVSEPGAKVGKFVAVPTRSWQPVLRSVKQREIDLFASA